MQIKQQILTASIASLALAALAMPADADVLAEYNFNSFANSVSNPSDQDVINSTAVTASNLVSDPDGTGNGDGLGTITATQTRDSGAVVFADTALAIGVGTTARNPFDPTSPTVIVETQDFLTFTLTADVNGVDLTSLSFDYGASVRPGDSTGLQSAAQLFASVNSVGFTAIGAREDRTVPAGAPGTFTGFLPASIDLSSLGTLSVGDSVEFRLSFGDNSGQSTTNKAVYVDNFVLNGNVVIPEPASI